MKFGDNATMFTSKTLEMVIFITLILLQGTIKCGIRLCCDCLERQARKSVSRKIVSKGLFRSGLRKKQ